MRLGPIDFLALEFPGNKFKGEILGEILDLVQAGMIRVLDLVVVLKDEEGNVVVRELQELDPEDIRVFDPLQVEVTSMITRGDIDDIAEALNSNCTAGLMLIENVWALKTMQAMVDANGRLLLYHRIPHDEVEAALKDIAELASSAQ
jgi:Family of unknown function (DUF6325)